MIFEPTRLTGVWIIDVEQHDDERGSFARTWCRREFDQHGLNTALVQCNTSFNRVKHTLRGLHYQAAPHAEAKLVRVTRGRAFDVAVDLRPNSPTFCQWVAAELSADNRQAIYIPEGCAHGFLTLEDDTELFYQMTAFYRAESVRGARYDDPAFKIDWPAAPAVISDRDRALGDFDPAMV